MFLWLLCPVSLLCFLPQTLGLFSQLMEIRHIIRVLDKLAPLKLAAKWDNVGLLVEPSSPHTIKHILLTNDLTEPVMDEAVQWQADMIISYHPPIFKPLKKLTNFFWKDRIVIRALENRIAIYSPHTACDATLGGVNDWLAGGLIDVVSSDPIEKSLKESACKLVKLDVSSADSDELLERLKRKFTVLNRTDACIELLCFDVEQLLETVSSSIPLSDIHIVSLSSKPQAHLGFGRICRLKQAAPLKDVVNGIKTHLCLDNVRLALGVGRDLDSEVATVALCAGSGGSVLKGIAADVYLTGEMSHHDVLDAVANKTSVILCEHSNTERGYLKEFARRLSGELDNDRVLIKVSAVDRDPLEHY